MEEQRQSLMERIAALQDLVSREPPGPTLGQRIGSFFQPMIAGVDQQQLERDAHKRATRGSVMHNAEPSAITKGGLFYDEKNRSPAQLAEEYLPNLTNAGFNMAGNGIAGAIPAGMFAGVIRKPGGNFLGDISGGSLAKGLNRTTSGPPEMGNYWDSIAAANPGLSLKNFEAMTQKERDALTLPHMNEEDIQKYAAQQYAYGPLREYFKTHFAATTDPVRLHLEQQELELAAKSKKNAEKIKKMWDKVNAIPEPTNFQEQAAKMYAIRDARLKEEEMTAKLLSEKQSLLPADMEEIDIDHLGPKRQETGFPEKGIAQGPLAKIWEDNADYNLRANKVGKDYQPHHYTQQNAYGDWINPSEGDTLAHSWMKKADPNTPVFELTSASTPRNMGFKILLDQLQAGIAKGEIKPELATAVTIPDLMKRASKERAGELYPEILEKMRAGANPATFHVSDALDSTKHWIEMRSPELKDEIHPDFAVTKMPGGGWGFNRKSIERGTISKYPAAEYGYTGDYATKEEAEAAARKAEADFEVSRACDFEGNNLNNCVGWNGYDERILGGDSRMFSLREKEGHQPHISVQFQKNKSPFQDSYIPDLATNLKHIVTPEEFAELNQKVRAAGFTDLSQYLRDANGGARYIENDTPEGIADFIAKHASPSLVERLSKQPESYTLSQAMTKSNAPMGPEHQRELAKFMNEAPHGMNITRVIDDPAYVKGIIDTDKWPAEIFVHARKTGNVPPRFMSQADSNAFIQKMAEEIKAAKAKEVSSRLNPQAAWDNIGQPAPRALDDVLANDPPEFAKGGRVSSLAHRIRKIKKLAEGGPVTLNPHLAAQGQKYRSQGPEPIIPDIPVTAVVDDMKVTPQQQKERNALRMILLQREQALDPTNKYINYEVRREQARADSGDPFFHRLRFKNGGGLPRA